MTAYILFNYGTLYIAHAQMSTCNYQNASKKFSIYDKMVKKCEISAQFLRFPVLILNKNGDLQNQELK